MSITIHIYYSGKNGDARRFAADMISEGVADAIRAKEGNLQYEYFLPMDRPESVLLIDRWKNQQALDEHHASPMMQTILKLREKYDLHMQVERYISDDNGIPEKDQAFIKP